ncbi:MAG: 4Fe-4S dicluster domain-containing protein [Candidatus Omnitrophica bacterium]|nr:4Fe-4S dicluster domain-containing protein [Candidatus Omnitrophota bacterium]
MTEKNLYFITVIGFEKLLSSLAERFRVIIPSGDNDYFWQQYSGQFKDTKYRATTSIRQFLSPCEEHIDSYFSSRKKDKEQFCIVGAKSCDLTSLYIQDFVFLEGQADQNYKAMRENNLIISSDCTSFKDVCFCLALDIKPYPEKFFDLNISTVEEGYLIEIGSVKGEKITEDHKNLFEEARPEHVFQRQEKRKEEIDQLFYHLKGRDLPPKDSLYPLTKYGYENAVWQENALRCVECGACIMNCPTCHCFLLFDEKNKNSYLRGRIWDGCQYKNFTRVAGGANPLKMRILRLRNRYIKKFEFFYEHLKLYACTGCGRCIECCPGKINLQEIFKTLKQTTKQKI